MTDDRLANLRREYSKSKLSRSSVSPDPIEQFGKWMDEALGSQLPEPAAMILSTVSAEGRPSSRVVLCKGFNGDGFVFFSNYGSRKGRDLVNNPFAALHFFCPELERQVNISGSVSKVSAEESDEYFASRPCASRIGAWASHQSEALRSRTELVKRAAALTLKYPTGNVPKLTTIEGRLGELEAQQRIVRGSLDQRHGQIAKLLGALQRMGRNPPPVMVTRRADALQMVRSAMLLAAAFPEMRGQAMELAGRLQELVRVMDDIRNESQRLKAETERLADAQTKLAGLMEERKQSLAQRKAELADVRRATADISKSVNDLNELNARVDLAVNQRHRTRRLRQGSARRRSRRSCSSDTGRQRSRAGLAAPSGRIYLPAPSPRDP